MRHLILLALCCTVIFAFPDWLEHAAGEGFQSGKGATEEVGHKVRQGFDAVGNKLHQGAETVKEGAKAAGRTVAHGAQKGVESVAHGAGAVAGAAAGLGKR